MSQLIMGINIATREESPAVTQAGVEEFRKNAADADAGDRSICGTGAVRDEKLVISSLARADIGQYQKGIGCAGKICAAVLPLINRRLAANCRGNRDVVSEGDELIDRLDKYSQCRGGEHHLARATFDVADAHFVHQADEVAV